MAVYVDELREYPGLTGQVARCGKWWCHMTADTDEELHAMAAAIGMKRSWFQPKQTERLNHYDLVPSRRAAAVARGAIEVNCAEHVRGILKRAREARQQAAALPPALPEGEHDWRPARELGMTGAWEACRLCGKIKRADGKNRPCPGPVKSARRGTLGRTPKGTR